MELNRAIDDVYSLGDGGTMWGLPTDTLWRGFHFTNSHGLPDDIATLTSITALIKPQRSSHLLKELINKYSKMVTARPFSILHLPANKHAQASESRLYTFSGESKDHLRKFRLTTSRAKGPQAVICMYVSFLCGFTVHTTLGSH
jgi:hypothetical protein